MWWCGVHCRIGHLFGFSVWAVHTVVSYDSNHSFPIWEALEYNRTGETSLWESGWGYVEFTPTRTFTRRFGRRERYCRDFLRVVVRHEGLERRYRGTACRNPRGAWWIVSEREVFGLSSDVRRGYENIRVNFKVKTDAENIEKLKALTKLSPVFDVTTKGTNVAVSIQRK